MCLLETWEGCWGLFASQQRTNNGELWVQPETLFKGNKAQNTAGEPSSILLWLLYTWACVCALTCTYMYANTAKWEECPTPKSKSSK